MEGNITVKCHFEKVPLKIKRICSNRSVGLFVASTCERHMNPYVPMDTGMLSQNTIVEPFKVTYNQEYAKRCFYGWDLNFRKEKHPLATSRWDKATESAKGNVIAKEISTYISKGRF